MYLFVINVFSGNGRGQRAWRKIEPILKRDQTPYRFIMLNTEQAMDAVLNHIHNKETAWKAVAIVGGDGTIHSLLPILINAGIPTGLIPAGSGNDTARELGIPMKPQAALKTLLRGSTIKLDLIRTTMQDSTSHYTLTAVATGFDGMIAAKVDQSFYKSWCNRLGLGSFAYIIALLQTLVTFRPFEVSVTIDGKKCSFEKGWLIAIANTSSYGGGLAICPTAVPDDQMLNICIVHSCTPLTLLSLFPTVLFGKHIKLPYVTMLTGQNIMIEANDDRCIPSLGDGESLGSPPLRAELVPQSLIMIK